MSDRDRRRDVDQPAEPPVVIRDKRKFDADGNPRPSAGPGQPGPAGAGSGATADTAAGVAGSGPSAGQFDPVDVRAAGLSQQDVDVQAELLDLREQLADRTADLQRLSAEYANYRKRVDRDREVVGEVATGRVLAALLPVLDDIERAAAHGDLTGAFKAVADKLVTALAGLGLEPFGAEGDRFDPSVHEAVLQTEDETGAVTEPVAAPVMRRGYRIGERLLRPAMVGVTAPPADSPARVAEGDDVSLIDEPADES